jgi:hypothetical protein
MTEERPQQAGIAHWRDPQVPGYGAPGHGFPGSALAPPAASPVPVHFYHLYAAGGGWPRVASEHFTALGQAGFTGEVRVGLVGSLGARQSARNWLEGAWPAWTQAASAEYGFEHVTLRALHAAVQGLPVNTPVLYAHTKGGWRQTPHQDLWRQCMQGACVTRWRECTAALGDGHDAAGAHWLPADGKVVGVPMFAGNFWWATAGYLAGLPGIRHRDRYDAEAWVGLGDPKVLDLVPAGWPWHPHRLG